MSFFPRVCSRMQSPLRAVFVYMPIRAFAVRTAAHVFRDIDLRTQRVSQVLDTRGIPVPDFLPLHAKWESSTAILVIPQDAIPLSAKDTTNYYFGGLPALMQAARKLDALGTNRSEKVVYVNDRQMPKTLQSGHQGHVHPSEWMADECNITNLFKTMLRGMGILREDNPSDLADYSYLHFPISIRDIFRNPQTLLSLYGSFFKQRIVHNLTSKQGISLQDRWVCDTIAKSLAYHNELSKRIEAETGHPTFTQNFRVYWSPNPVAIKKKKDAWTALGICCEWMSKKEIMEHTLLKTDRELHVLKIFGDGKFYPDGPDRIVAYLKRHYPNFSERHSHVKEIYIDRVTGRPLKVVEEDLTTKEYLETAVSTLFGSPGHNNVLRYDPIRNNWNPMWREVPVSGISSTWRCEIERQEFSQRFGPDHLNDKQLSERVTSLAAAANLNNLHVTTWEGVVKPKKVELLVRATQGANFNRMVANKLDLLNMRNNLDRYFMGDWELISVGSCTRKTWVSNVPEFVRLHGNSGFIHGLSGLGYSWSGAPPEDLIHP